MNFEPRAKDSLGEGIADMRWQGIPNGGTGEGNDRRPKTKYVCQEQHTRTFHQNAKRREERPF